MNTCSLGLGWAGLACAWGRGGIVAGGGVRGFCCRGAFYVLHHINNKYMGHLVSPGHQSLRFGRNRASVNVDDLTPKAVMNSLNVVSVRSFGLLQLVHTCISERCCYLVIQRESRSCIDKLAA